ncbi:MAG: AAA family ATPase [Verrucomicrobia bacterium]|nr:AAA family ATPase [Verrucomicrobiota bacterium]
MHLSSLTVERFRSCSKTVVDFQDDLTVLVGENNGGKSNIIDALRLLTLPLNGRRERYPEDEDLRRGATSADFQFIGQFAGLSDTLKGLLITAVPDVTQNVALFGYRHETRSAAHPRGLTTQWAGKFETAEAEAGSTELIRHVYLPALRDAHQALGSGSGARVMALFRHFLPKEQEKAFLESVRRDEFPEVLTTINTAIGNSLSVLTTGVRPQQAKLDFATESLLDVARSLRFTLADAGLSLDDIRASGLGYSNLLYIATVVVELAKAKESDLTLFLVEEPEAHLHPQLQMLVLEFLLEKARESRPQAAAGQGAAPPPPAGQPEGLIQVIVSTHSPNLTAWVSPKHLVVVRSQEVPPAPAAVLAAPAVAPAPAPAAAAPAVPVLATSHTVAVPVAKLGIEPKMLDKISRYLDVTRSALLFGNRALLVEGVAESLLPAIAQHISFKNDRTALSRFKGAVLVAIEGVDFRPYVEILLRPHNGARIADCVVVVTDADPAVAGNRKADLDGFAAGVDAAAALSVYINQHTLEHELMAAGNEAFLKAAFLVLHPNSGADWAAQIEGVAAGGRPAAFLALIEAKKTRKEDLAQVIAARISEGEAFQVPGYLTAALGKIVEP